MGIDANGSGAAWTLGPRVWGPKTLGVIRYPAGLGPEVAAALLALAVAFG